MLVCFVCCIVGVGLLLVNCILCLINSVVLNELSIVLARFCDFCFCCVACYLVTLLVGFEFVC